MSIFAYEERLNVSRWQHLKFRGAGSEDNRPTGVHYRVNIGWLGRRFGRLPGGSGATRVEQCTCTNQ